VTSYIEAYNRGDAKAVAAHWSDTGQWTSPSGERFNGREAIEKQLHKLFADGAAGTSPQNEDWLPLGVFAVVAEPTQTQADKVVQLAVNKEGVIRGNLQDALTDKVVPVSGAIDKQSQRVAMKIEGIDNVVVETGLYNLTNDEVPVLVHFGPDRQESRTLMRLQSPEEANQPKS
jgi:hypothetical protein